MDGLAQDELRSFAEAMLGMEILVFGAVTVVLGATEMVVSGTEVNRDASGDPGAGLGLDTKFDLGNRAKLRFDDEWLAPSPNKRFGDHPKRGILNTADDNLKCRLSSAGIELKQATRPKELDMTARPTGGRKRNP